MLTSTSLRISDNLGHLQLMCRGVCMRLCISCGFQARPLSLVTLESGSVPLFFSRLHTSYVTILPAKLHIEGYDKRPLRRVTRCPDVTGCRLLGPGVNT